MSSLTAAVKKTHQKEKMLLIILVQFLNDTLLVQYINDILLVQYLYNMKSDIMFQHDLSLYMK